MPVKKEENKIDHYVNTFPADVQQWLMMIRAIIRKTAPRAIETISYGIPTFKINDTNLVHFAAFKKHIGFYPTPSAIRAFQKELAPYKQAKGSIQFPLDKPIPMSLIQKMVKFRMKEVQPAKK